MKKNRYLNERKILRELEMELVELLVELWHMFSSTDDCSTREDLYHKTFYPKSRSDEKTIVQ